MNSKLVDYTKISPNSTNPRNTAIKKITIHHMAGNMTVEQCGSEFQKTSRQASSNYGIGTDGRIGLYVEEKNRAWTSSNYNNDNQAVTIEVANDGGAPNWHVSDKAYASLIELCTDICKRNGITKLIYDGTKNGNLTTHRMFVATLCPGPFLNGKMEDIVKKVNVKLQAPAASPAPSLSNTSKHDSAFIVGGIDYNYVFDPVYYAGRYSDLKKAFGSDKNKLFQHFLKYGMKEARQAISGFNVRIYRSKNSDLRNKFGNDLIKYYKHYCQYGCKEKRKSI